MATQAQNLSREVAHACLTGTGPLRTKEFTFFAHFPELFDLFFEVFPRFLQNSRVFHVFHTPFCSPKPPKYPTLPPPAPLSPCTLHAPPTPAHPHALRPCPPRQRRSHFWLILLNFSTCSSKFSHVFSKIHAFSTFFTPLFARPNRPNTPHFHPQPPFHPAPFTRRHRQPPAPTSHYICREPSTNQPFLCKTNPISTLL